MERKIEIILKYIMGQRGVLYKQQVRNGGWKITRRKDQVQGDWLD